MNVIVDEPSTYQEVSRIPAWQLAMSEELAAFDRQGTWDLVPLPSHTVVLHISGYSKLRPSPMAL